MASAGKRPPFLIGGGKIKKNGAEGFQRASADVRLFSCPLVTSGSYYVILRRHRTTWRGASGDVFSAICCLQIFRFTSSKPSEFAFASDEKSIRQPTTSFVRCYPNSHLNHVIRTASFPSRLCFVPLARTSSTPRFTQFCQNEKSAMLDAMLYYFQIHLRHLLAPFPLCRPVVPLSVALLRCISLPLARTKNSRRILAHSHLEIVLV